MMWNCPYFATRDKFNIGIMAGRGKDVSGLIQTISDEAVWNSVLELSEEKLVIMDCHQEWCGPCVAVVPTLSRIFIDIDNAPERIHLCTASFDLHQERIGAILPTDSNISLEKIGCVPLFLFIRFKQCVSVVQGADAPGITQQVSMNVPDMKKKDDDEM